MAYYRRRIETVEAVQFLKGQPWPEEVRPYHASESTHTSDGYVLSSPLSTATALPIHYGDFIIRDQDLRRVARPDVFLKTFELQPDYV